MFGPYLRYPLFLKKLLAPHSAKFLFVTYATLRKDCFKLACESPPGFLRQAASHSDIGHFRNILFDLGLVQREIY